MLQFLSQKRKPHWKRALAMLLVVLTVLGMFPATAFAAEDGRATYAVTGDFEVNAAGSTGWNGIRDALSVFDSEDGDTEIVTIPSSDDAAPVPFVILADNGGDRVKIGLVSDDAGNVVPWTGGAVDGTGWVEKKYIFVNLPDVLPSIAYNLTNASGSIFSAADGTELPGVTGSQLYAGKRFNVRLDRKEYTVPCMYPLAQRLAKVQKAAMSNGETLVIYEAFRPATVQSAVRDGLKSLMSSSGAVSADMKKAQAMGYGWSWFIAGGTSNHQAGLAVDMTLAKGNPEELYAYSLDGVAYQKYEAWTEYDMPSAMHELSSSAIRWKSPVSSAAMPGNLENWTEAFAASDGAKRLQKYCTDAGLIPLASEWWHFNDPGIAEIMAKGKYSKSVPIHTAGDYIFDAAPSVTPSQALEQFVSRPAKAGAAATSDDDGPTGGTGGLNPGSPGGQSPTRKDVAWTTDPERTFLRFTLIEFPEGVVKDLNNNEYETWHVKGTPLNVVWGQGKYENWDAETCRKNITWYNSCAMQYNGMGANAPQLMKGGSVPKGIYAYDATAGYNQRWVTTADEFQAATGISDYEKSQMFHCHASDWTDGWTNGDYTSMWGHNPKPVTPNNEYMVYTANKAFLYLLSRLTEVGSNGQALPGWSEDVALKNWSEYVHDADGNLRTKYRIIIETGGIFRDPDGNRRAYTLREMMAYTLYNNEPVEINHLIYDQTSTIKNMAQYMRQRKDNQFLEYPLDGSGKPTGEELHSTNGFTECDSFVDSIGSPRDIRDTIFNNRRSYGLHILSPFNFETPTRDKLSLDVTKKVSGTIPGTDSWGFTVAYTAGTPRGFTAQRNGVDCTSEVTDTGSGLKFTLKADETMHIDFDADASFRFEVTEDDPTYLTNITGTGGTADLSAKKFTSSGGEAKVTFTNGTTTAEKKPVYLKLKKIAAADQRPLSGAVFSVYADAACSGTVLATMTTGADGTASTSVPNIVEDGGSVTLYVKETQAPAGCTPLDTPFTVTCKAPENSTEAGAVQVGPASGIENGGGPGPGKTILYKRDAVTNQGVGPATFKFSSVTNGDYEFDTDENGELEPIQWWDTSEKDGKYIKPGEYAVTEIVPPPGYEPTTEVQQIKLELDANGNPIPAGPLVFKNLAKVGLRIVKYDRTSHQPMKGVTFEIYRDGTSIGRYETDANGEILLTGIAPGTYRAVEVDTGDDGHILDASWQEVELVAGDGTKDLFFFNDKKPGMKLVKVDSADPSKTISGVKFRIRAIDGSFGPQEFVTDGNGEIDLSKLPTGSYEVTELECPGYVVDDAQRIIHLRANDTAEFVFTNTKKPGLRLIKTSADGTPLDGVIFRIARIEDGSRYLDRTTQNGGEILVEDLEPGMYSVQEIATLPDHILDETEHHVELFPGKTSEIRLKNDKRPTLIISKTDKDTGAPVPGVTFTLRGADGPTITTKPTGADGKIIITDLLPGPYTITEQNVPEGYILDTTPQTVTLFPNREAQVEFQNHQRPTLKIVKVDINGKRLTGAIFEVKTKAGVKIGDFPVNANGEITVPQKHLTEGYYIITEIQAPEGYILDKTPHEVYLRPGKTTEVSIENEKKPGLTIYKVDSIVGDGIKGAKFEIWVSKDKNQNGTYQQLTSNYFYTDANGIIHLDNLDTGWYKIIEVEPPAGFMLKEPSEQIIYIEHDTSVEVTFENIPKSALVIRKIDSDTGAPLANAWFRVRYLGGTSGSGGTIIGEYQTSSNGNIVITGLDAGTYVVEEISAPHGYVMDTAPQTAYISGKEQDCITLTFTNSKYGAVLIKKVDSVTGEPLSDIQFFVTTSDGAVVGNSNGYFPTDSAGTILIPDLMPGTTLVVKETRTRPGYVLDEVPQTVKIDSNETKTLEFRNQPMGSLLIRKVCSVNPSVTLQDAEFKVAYSDGSLVGDSNGVYRSDENGEVRIDGLIPGRSVVVTETRAPAGFLIDTQSQTVMIQAGKTVSVTMKNQPKGQLIVQKRDSDTGDPLPGAQFRITTAAGCEVGLDGVIGTSTLTSNGIFTTDSNGEIRITNLAPGAYVLTEIKAPAGYVMDSPSTNVVIGANGDTQTVIVTNTKKGGLIIEKYDSVTKQPLAGAQFKVTTASGELVPDNEGLTSSNGLYTTDRNGQIVLSKLLPGTYIVTEEKAPDNYRKDPTPQTVVVNAADTQTVRFYDDPLCTLTILKRDAVTKKPLARAEFLVRDSEGRAVGPNNGRYITGTDGTVTVTGLEPNATIVVSEVKAPTGYILDETPKNIVVRTGVANSLIFDNQPGTTLIIKKFIEGTENEPLSGVAFKVIDGSGAAVGPDDGIYYTDHAGEIVLSGIEPGTTVTAREIKTVEGFVLDGTPQNILIKGGEVQSLTFWNKRDCSLTILKQSTDKTPLTGAVFHVTDEDGAAIGTNNGRYTSDRNGLITITGLQPGQILIVTEEKAPNGYVLDMTPKTIKIKQGIANSLIFENARTGKLVINKYSALDRKTPLEGVTFKITTTNGDFLPDEDGKISSNGLYYTDSTGQIILNSVVGSVVVTEVQSIPGYTISDANRTQVVEVKPDDTQTLYFYNEPLCSLTIKKLDSVTGKPVPGTEFTVKDGNGNMIGKYTTGQDGTVTVAGLVPGSAVVVTETKVPSGYVLNPIPQTIIVKNGTGNNLTSGGSGGNGWSSSGNDLVFENDPKTTLTIEKYLETETGNKPLKGVTFLVTDSSGAVVGPNNGEYITGEDGRIVIPNLEPGTTITAREIKVPEGVLLDSTPKSIQIKTGEGQTLRFVNQRAGTLVVRKLDKISKAPLSGVEFEITYAEGGYVDDANGHLSSKGRYTTNDMGEIRLSVTGTVVVKEVTPCPGYVIDTATQIQTVKVNPADTQTLVFYNEPLCSLTLTKRDSVTGKPVPGTEFTLKDGNGNILGKYTTGQDGTVTVTGLIPGSTVIAVETRVPKGYVLDPTPKTIIVKNGAGNSIVSGGGSAAPGGNGGNNLDFENDPTTTLIIRKFISGTANEPLPGVAFKVVDGSGKPVGPDNGTYYTNNAGEIVLDNLEPGMTVTAREIKTVDGFVLDGDPQTIEIKAGGKQQLTFWNKRAGTLVIQKKDKLTGKPLAGVEFQVTDTNGSYVPDENGHISSNGLYTTDVNGEIRIKGVTGTLVVRETKTIAGYTIDEAARTQTVTVNPEDVQTLTFYNTPNSTLVIEKYVEGTNEPLKGVTFLVTDSSGAFVGKANGEYVTDENGRIEISGLTPGETVTVKEIRTLEGYILDTQPKSVRVTEGEAHTLKFYNQRQGTLVIRKLDKLTKEPLAGVEFELTYAEGGYVDDANGHLSSKGLYTTDANGEIRISGISGTIVVKETKTLPGYTIDPGTQSQTVVVNSADTQTITFYNTPGTTLTIQKYVDGTTDPIQGVTFLITDSAGTPLGPNQGEYVTDRNGRIVLNSLTPGTTIIAKEVRAADGYVLDGQPQSVLIKEGEAQQITFYNKAFGGVEIIKVDAADKTKRLANVSFEIRRMDGGLVDTVTTGSDGRVELDLDAGDYYAVEIEAAEGYKLDNTPTYFTVEDGKPTSITITNNAFSGILLHKTDSVTGKGISGVTFLLYDSANKPIGQYTTDNTGYIYIEDLTVSGRYFLKELENKGYIVDTELKTVYVTAGETTLVEWKNTPITGQIQVTKTSAEYNTMNGWPAGTPLPNTEFEIYEQRSGNLVDTIKTDKNGVAKSRPLPLGRYKIVESKSADFYGLDKTPIEVEIEYAGQIVKAAMTNKSLYTNVSITKRGYSEVVPGQSIKYDFSGIANNSTTSLTSFYWRDTLPTKAVRLDKIVTGTYNVPGNYKIVYKTNLSSEYRTLADNVSTQQNKVIIASPAALGLASNEYVTEFMCVFGVVPANFRQVEAPAVYCNVLSNLTGGTQFVNQADVGGVYNGQWIMATDRWVTTVYKPSKPLPRTGY